MADSKRQRLIAYDDDSWVEEPMRMTVHTAEDDDAPEILLPDHDAGGWRAHPVHPSKRRLGFLP